MFHESIQSPGKWITERARPLRPYLYCIWEEHWYWKRQPGWVSDLDLACLKHQIAECCDHVHVCTRCTLSEENSCTRQETKSVTLHIREINYGDTTMQKFREPQHARMLHLPSCSGRSNFSACNNTFFFCLDVMTWRSNWTMRLVELTNVFFFQME
jgi:hypothetical protein